MAPIRKNASRKLPSSSASGQQQVLPPCQPAQSPPTHTSHDTTNAGDNLTIDKRYNTTRASEEICVTNMATPEEGYSEDNLVHIACRWMCNCIPVNKLDKELEMDDMLEKHTSNKHDHVNKMKQDVFLQKKMNKDVKMMRMKATKGANNGKKRKEKVATIVEAPKVPSASSKSVEVKTLANSDLAQVGTSKSGVVVSASVPTLSGRRKRRMVAYDSGHDYYFYTQFGESCVM